MANLLRHRVAFNCNLYMTLSADPEAQVADLERMAIARIRGCMQSPENQVLLADIAIPVESLDEYDGCCLYVRCLDSSLPDEQLELENFTIENVEGDDAVIPGVDDESDIPF